MIKKLCCHTTPESSFTNEISLTALRVITGLLMAYLHGMGKVPPSEKFLAGVTGLGFPMPAFFAWAAGISEFLGGLFLAVGLFTRLSALLVACTMLVAAFGRHLADPLDVKELSLLYLVVALVFITRGAGRLSLDHLFMRK